MNCEEVQNLRHAYADGELDLIRMTQVERHLRDCSACSEAQENIRALSSALKSGNLYFTTPRQIKQLVAADVRRRRSKQISVPGRPGISPDWFALRNIIKFAVFVAGTAAVAFLLAAAFMRPSADQRLAQEITANHVRSLMAAHLTDVVSSDQHAVKPWFDGRIDFAPPVKDLATQGFALVGGRLDYLQDRQVAALVYQRHNHPINLFIWPATHDPNPREKESVWRGYNLIHWTRAGMNFWAVSDLNAAELQEFVKLIQS